MRATWAMIERLSEVAVCVVGLLAAGGTLICCAIPAFLVSLGFRHRGRRHHGRASLADPVDASQGMVVWRLRAAALGGRLDAPSTRTDLPKRSRTGSIVRGARAMERPHLVERGRRLECGLFCDLSSAALDAGTRTPVATTVTKPGLVHEHAAGGGGYGPRRPGFGPTASEHDCAWPLNAARSPIPRRHRRRSHRPATAYASRDEARA